MMLALDTSTNDASIALTHEGRLLAELTWAVGQRHSTELLERLNWLLDWQRVPAESLDGVAVATGPGSFNGVRVAVTTAKTLAFALGVPLYGHSTLDVIAWGYAFHDGPIWSILEAGRGQVYAAQYSTRSVTARSWSPTGEYTILTPAELATQIAASSAGPALICGEWRPETRAALESIASERIRFVSRQRSRQAVWLAELAQARMEQGSSDDPATLEPLYLRRPAITTSAKKPLVLRQSTDQHSQTKNEIQSLDEEGEGAARALQR